MCSSCMTAASRYQNSKEKEETLFQIWAVNFRKEKCGFLPVWKDKCHIEATSILGRSLVCLKTKMFNIVPEVELSVFPQSMLRVHELVNGILELFIQQWLHVNRLYLCTNVNPKASSANHVAKKKICFITQLINKFGELKVKILILCLNKSWASFYSLIVQIQTHLTTWLICLHSGIHSNYV